MPPQIPIAARDTRRDALLAVMLDAIGDQPELTWRSTDDDPVRELLGHALDALDTRGALVERLDPPCPGTLDEDGARWVCDGVAGHRPRVHWRVDRRTGTLRSWMTAAEQDDLDASIERAVRS